MNRQEIMDSIKHLKWTRNEEGLLRCERGDCPLTAAMRIQKIYEGEEILSNAFWRSYGSKLGLTYNESIAIVLAADDEARYGKIPELETV